MVKLSVNKSEWSCMQMVSTWSRRRDNMHVCEAIHCNGHRWCKNNIMHVTIVRCKRKLKWCFYKLTHIKVRASTHWNQEDNLNKEKHKKWQKRNERHVKHTYLETTNLKVPKAPGCNVRCQSCKIDVRNELYNIWFIIFDKIEVMTCMPQI